MTVYEEIFEVLKERKKQFDSGNAPEKSYTCYLYKEGVDKICKKVGEEAVEAVIEAVDGNRDRFVYEASDLIYHLLVLLEQQGVTLSDLEHELALRHR